jgi:hypothetical protein
MLNGNPATECLNPLQVSVADGLGVINEPTQTIYRTLAMDPFENIKKTTDSLVLGSVNTPGPISLNQIADHLFQF